MVHLGWRGKSTFMQAMHLMEIGEWLFPLILNADKALIKNSYPPHWKFPDDRVLSGEVASASGQRHTAPSDIRPGCISV